MLSVVFPKLRKSFDISMTPAWSSGLRTGLQGIAIPVIPGSIPGRVSVDRLTIQIVSGLGLPQTASNQPMQKC